MEILTIDEVASLLKLSKRTIAELMQKRTRSGDLREHPLPAIRIGRSVRFRKTDVEAWVEKLVVQDRNGNASLLSDRME